MAERTPSRRAARARSAKSLGFPPAKPYLLGACSCYSDTLLVLILILVFVLILR
jgi:hypothetical protein